MSRDDVTPFPLNDPDDEFDPLVRRLRRALAQEAEMVHTDDNGLDQITQRISDEEPRRPWAPWLAGVAAAAVVAAVVGVAVTRDTGDTGDGGQPAANPSVSTTQPTQPATPSAPVTTSPATTAPAAAPLSGVPVYWIGESRKRPALYREFRSVPDTGGIVTSAIAAMTRETPLDPDYGTPWEPASRVEVTQSGAALTVDLSADAFSGTQVGSELAALAVQQLVYTATAAADVAGTPASTVRITVDGQPYDAWGVVQVGEPTQRAPIVQVLAHTWVTSPAEGDTLPAGTVKFSGYGTSFEANFPWQVRDQAGTVVAEGYAMGGDGMGGFGEFTFTARLAPGRYTVEISGDDASGGAEGPGAATDDKTFTVR